MPEKQAPLSSTTTEKEVKSIEIQVTPEKLVEGGGIGGDPAVQVAGKKRRRKRVRKQEGENGGNVSGGLNEARGG